MSHLSKLFTQTPIDIPNRSGFDMSFENLLTMQVGTLVPVLCEEVIPNETYSLGYLGQVQLPPMATNFFGRVDMRLEAFFVPNRIIWGGWQNFFTMPTSNPYGSPTVRPISVPTFHTENTQDPLVFPAGSLGDYLGIKSYPAPETATQELNLMPFLAYHRIWDEWYRNSKITKPAFVRQSGNASRNLSNIPWNSLSYGLTSTGALSHLADGVSVFSLRQRCWAKDYFTTSALYPQANGGVQGASVTVPEKGELTISSLRSANVLQRWLERNNIAGERYADQINAHYGVLPSDALVDRPLFLGSSKFGIYNRSVMQSGGSSTSQNPFTSLGTKGGSSAGYGDDSLIKKFHSTEHGYLIVLASIVPHANYSSGIRRYLAHTNIGDYAFPLMQGLGEQPIYTYELDASKISEKTIFGYQQQYSEYKYHDDEVHGLLRPGESLDSFVLSRKIDNPVLSTDFLEIKPTAMDNVTATVNDLSKYGAWADFFFTLKKVSPLSEYVQPTLGDLKNTHKKVIDYRGRQL